MTKYDIIIYSDKSGNEPFSNWVKKLQDDIRNRISSRIDRLRLGNFGDTKSVGDGVYELRFFFGSGYRVYYGLKGKEIVILLCGGDKASQKKDIKKAKEYLEDFENG